jgi:hypothetical protein
MRELTWENFSQEYDCYWLKITKNKPILIPKEIWHNLINLKGDLIMNTPVIHDLKNTQKFLNITTLKKLIQEAKKIDKQDAIKQLDLI